VIVEGLQAFLYRAIATNQRLVRFIEAGSLTEPTGSETSHSPAALDNFPHAARVQAMRMGSVYEVLYCLENSVRDLIERTLRETLGPEKWWTEGVPEPIRKGAEKRREEDVKARWHSTRGESLINYVDFPQYADIILAHWDWFEELIGDRDWLSHYFDEMNRSRRALAHTGSLSETDVERMDFRVREWLRVVG
jgi:hypothetical protein